MHSRPRKFIVSTIDDAGKNLKNSFVFNGHKYTLVNFYPANSTEVNFEKLRERISTWPFIGLRIFPKFFPHSKSPESERLMLETLRMTDYYLNNRPSEVNAGPFNDRIETMSGHKSINTIQYYAPTLMGACRRDTSERKFELLSGSTECLNCGPSIIKNSKLPAK